LIYFIYSGVVQESVPLIHYLNENGVVYKCTTFFEVDSTKRSMQEMATKDQFKRRICLELNVYQDHDICGEYTVTFNKKISTTDLLAVTDVKALVMDVSRMYSLIICTPIYMHR
jgi:hypothetical protein